MKIDLFINFVVAVTTKNIVLSWNFHLQPGTDTTEFNFKSHGFLMYRLVPLISTSFSN